MVIPDDGRRNGGGGDRGGGDIFPLPLEHHRPVYYDSSDTGASYGGGTAARSTSVITVVGEGRCRPRPRGGEYG